MRSNIMLKNNDFELYRKWTVALTITAILTFILTVSYVVVEIITHSYTYWG